MAFLGLILIVIPYSIQALRVGIYPQLAKPWASMTDHSRYPQTVLEPAQRETEEKVSVDRKAARKAVGVFKDSVRGAEKTFYRCQHQYAN